MKERRASRDRGRAGQRSVLVRIPRDGGIFDRFGSVMESRKVCSAKNTFNLLSFFYMYHPSASIFFAQRRFFVLYYFLCRVETRENRYARTGAHAFSHLAVLVGALLWQDVEDHCRGGDNAAAGSGTQYRCDLAHQFQRDHSCRFAVGATVRAMALAPAHRMLPGAPGVPDLAHKPVAHSSCRFPLALH
jgi:hypothetical protein